MPEHLPIPTDWADLTPSWLQPALGDSEVLPAGRSITAVRADRGAGGIAVCGRVARLIVELEPSDSEPRSLSLFAKLRNRAWNGDPRVYRQEVRFYRDLAPRIDLAVPRCHYADHDAASGDFVIVLEDLTEASPGHRLGGCDFASTLLLIEEVGRLHGAWWGGEDLTTTGWTRQEPSVAQLESWLTRFRAEWEPFASHPSYRVGESLREAVRKTSNEAFLDSGLRLAGAPATLVHQDLHVENVLFDERSGSERVWIVDWQESGLGHPARDLAFILAGDATEEVRRDRGEELLTAYCAILQGFGISYPLDRVREDVRAAVRWQFLYQVLFLNGFEAATDHDRRTLAREWQRISSAFRDLEGQR